MSKRVGIIFALGLFFSALLVLSLEPRAKFPEPERTGSALEDVRVTHNEDGENRWDLVAVRADLGRDMKVAVLEDLELRIHMEKPIRVTGQKGVYRFDRGEMSITEDAVLQTEDWTLRTRKLDWDSADGRMVTDQPVTMEARSFRLEGRGFEADTRKETARVSDVRCTFYAL